MFERHCPTCNREIRYKNESSCQYAEKRHTECRPCFTTHNNPFRGRQHSAETKELIASLKRGKKHTLEARQHMSEAHQGERNHFYGKKHSDETKALLCEKGKRFRGEANPFFGKKHTPETRTRMSKSRSAGIASGRIVNTNGFGRKGWFVTKCGEQFYFDSKLEQFRMLQLEADSSITNWTKRHGIKIPYTHDGKSMMFVPDFLIQCADGHIVLEEVKGHDKKAAAKKQAMLAYCVEHEFECRWLAQDELEKQGYRAWLESENE